MLPSIHWYSLKALTSVFIEPIFTNFWAAHFAPWTLYEIVLIIAIAITTITTTATITVTNTTNTILIISDQVYPGMNGT